MKFVRRWPWVLAAAGICLFAFYLVAVLSRRSRDERETSGPFKPPARPDLVMLEGRIRELGKQGKFAQALTETEASLALPDLNQTELVALRLWKGRFLRSLGRPAEAVFRSVLQSRCDSSDRGIAYGELVSLKVEKKDYLEAISVCEEILNSSLDDRDLPGTDIMQVEANYRHSAAFWISELYEKLGDPRRAHRWALKAKTDFPFDSFCGTAIMGAHEMIEDRLEHTAELAGISYAREEFSWKTRSRRLLGIPVHECMAGMFSGLSLLAIAIVIHRVRRRHLRIPWSQLWRKFIWRKRSGDAIFGLSVGCLILLPVLGFLGRWSAVPSFDAGWLFWFSLALGFELLFCSALLGSCCGPVFPRKIITRPAH